MQTVTLPESPRVSVLLPAYRAASTLERAVRSALDQQGVSLEVLLVVDGCPETQKVAQALPPDARLRISINMINLGTARARNQALSLARGHFVAQLDADDALLPDALARAVAAFDEPSWGEAGHDARQYLGAVYGDVLLEDEAGTRTRLLHEPRFTSRAAFLRQPFETPFLMVRRQLLLDVGGYDEVAVRCWSAGVLGRISRLRAVRHLGGAPFLRHRVDGLNQSLRYRPDDCQSCISSTTCGLAQARRQQLGVQAYGLRKLSLVLTTRCNLDCGYCYTRRYKWDLALEDVLRLLVQAAEAGASLVSFTGGEPSLYRGFDTAILASVRLGLEVLVISNGWNWSDERLSRFLSYPRCHLMVSLEGVDAEHHDAIRGKGSFATLMRFMERVRTMQPTHPLSGMIIATPENLEQLEGLVAFSLDHLKLAYVRVDRVAASGNAEFVEQFSPEHTQRFLEICQRLREKYGSQVLPVDESFSAEGCPLFLAPEQGFQDLHVFSDGTVPACVFMHMDRPSRVGMASSDLDTLLSHQNVRRTKAIIDVAFRDHARQVQRKGLFTCVECMERRNTLDREGLWPEGGRYGRHLQHVQAWQEPISSASLPEGRPRSAAERGGMAPPSVLVG